MSDSCSKPTVEDLARIVRVDFPDALAGVIQQKLRYRAHMFFKETDAAREWIREDSQSCHTAYLLELDNCWHINNVLCVRDNGCEVHPAHRKNTQCGGGYWKTGNTIHIDPAPMKDCPGGLEFWVSKYPSITGCDGPLYMPEEYASTLIEGVKSDLFGMREEPWFDRGMKLFHEGRYQNGVNDAHDSAMRDEVNGKPQRHSFYKRGGYLE